MCSPIDFLGGGKAEKGEELGRGIQSVRCGMGLRISPFECHKHSGVVHYLIFKIYFELNLKELCQLSLDVQKLPSWFDVYYQI